MQKYISSELIIFFVLLILLIFFKLFILFFTGIHLGGDESYETAKLLHLFQSNKLSIASLGELTSAYSLLGAVLQIFFAWPFLAIYPTNEFSIFLGTMFLTILVFVLTYFWVKKFFGPKSAISFSLIYIFSPLGFTLNTISSDSPPGAMIFILTLLPFFYSFFSPNQKYVHLSAIILAILPLFTPYHLILWPTVFLYLTLQSFFSHSNISSLLKTNIIYFSRTLATILVFLPYYFAILFSAINKFSSKLAAGYSFFPEHLAPFLISKLLDRTFMEFKRLSHPFWPDDLLSLNLNLTSMQLYMVTSLMIFVYLLANNSIRAIKSCFCERKINITIFFIIYLVLFVLGELFFQIKIHNWNNRLLSLESKYLMLFLFASFLVVANVKSLQKFLFFILITCNIMVNLNSTNLQKESNFITYNLGNVDYQRNEVAIYLPSIGQQFYKIKTDLDSPVTFLKILSKDLSGLSLLGASLFAGLGSREYRGNKNAGQVALDYILYGYGMRMFYQNSLGINWCYFLTEKTQQSECQRGYRLSSEQLKQHLSTLHPYPSFLENLSISILTKDMDTGSKATLYINF
ncbi:MAG: hypothetical protein HQK50_05715 [Oligoflexia bacterium]|nr:hypothetical protein [Oligoflexia bacterium]